jgi:hypothetical protein
LARTGFWEVGTPLQLRLAVPARLENRLLTLLFLWHNLSP